MSLERQQDPAKQNNTIDSVTRKDLLAPSHSKRNSLSRSASAENIADLESAQQTLSRKVNEHKTIKELKKNLRTVSGKLVETQLTLTQAQESLQSTTEESAQLREEIRNLQTQLEKKRNEAKVDLRTEPSHHQKVEEKLIDKLKITEKQLAEAKAEAKQQKNSKEQSETLLRETSQRMDALLIHLTTIEETEHEKPQSQKTHWLKYFVAGAGTIVGGLLIASGVGAPIGIPLFTGGTIVASTLIAGGGSFIGAKATYQNPSANPEETSWWQYVLAGTLFLIGIALTITGIGSSIGIPLIASAVLGGTSLFAGSALVGYTHAKQQIAKSYNAAVQATQAIKKAASKPIITEVKGNAISHIALPTPHPSATSPRNVQPRSRTFSAPAATTGNLHSQQGMFGSSRPIPIPGAEAQPVELLSPSPHLP